MSTAEAEQKAGNDANADLQATRAQDLPDRNTFAGRDRLSWRELNDEVVRIGQAVAKARGIEFP